MPEQTIESNISTETSKPDFGAGRYSALMEESFRDAQIIFGLSPDKAEKLARQIGSDFGAVMRTQVVDARIGKAMSKDGKVTLSEASKAKGVACTNALSAMRAMSYANDCGKYGFSRGDTDWSVSGTLKEYLENI